MNNSLCRLFLLFHAPTVPSASPAPVQVAQRTLINFDAFSKGIDNVHIDIRLSPKFQAKAKRMIADLLDQEAGAGRWGGTAKGPSRQEWEEYRLTYARMLEATVHRAKTSGGTQLVQLVQVSAIKFVIGRVQADLDVMRQTIRATMTSGGEANDSQRIEMTERLAWLARNRARLRYKIVRQLFAPILKTEEGTLGDLRQSVIGQRWSLPEEVIGNPLLQAENPFDEEVQMKQYVLLPQGSAQEAADAYTCTALDRLLPNVFRPPKPANELEAALAKAELAHGAVTDQSVALKKKLGRTKKAAQVEALTKQVADVEAKLAQATSDLDRCQTEYLKEHYAWADVPANVELLFDTTLSRARMAKAKQAKDKQQVAEIKKQIQFQHRLLAVAERYFRKSSLLVNVVAAYEIVPCYKDYAGVLTAVELHQFVADPKSRKALLAKIKDKKVKGQPLSPAPLLQAVTRVGQLSWRQERAYLVRFLKDFLTFRRDLVNGQLIQQAMGRIELQEDPKNLRLSRANRTLLEFLGTGEEGAVAQTVLNHVILKADMRGSTTMVAELRKRGLNPASHFSLNFFEPLNEVLATYGANKVFIEGDAVILSLMEHEEAVEHHYSVARMCGIAKRLLGMVQAQNAACRKDGLPELELGTGIVYSEEPPTFLYDGNNEIMISSAIGKADRLSSCSWMLRKERAKRDRMLTNVDIYEIPEGDPLRGEKGEVHLRYNLNGIELDEDGLFKLQTELTMQEVEVSLPGDDTPISFYVGRYPDLKGALHRVVIRQGRIRLLDTAHPRFGLPTADVFYEVVTDEEVLRLVAQVAKQGEGEVE
ncbi:MAG: hypothetical protein ACKOCD_02645 [Nitrospiraceae bacterium]